MLNEFTAEELGRTTCRYCQCRDCKNENCPVPCRANAPCEASVTMCQEYKAPKEEK